MESIALVGFDSAWTNRKKNPGAICALVISNETARFIEPRLCTFEEAQEFVERISNEAKLVIVGIDQPLIVPNLQGGRPVDLVVSSFISWAGGGVQLASRKRSEMFGDEAPIWRFLTDIKAELNPETAREAKVGCYAVEVFPALALLAFETAFCGRLQAPKYNPANRKKFKSEDWHAVIKAVISAASRMKLHSVAAYSTQFLNVEKPTKSEQDMLDSVICLLVIAHWRRSPRNESLMIGGLDTGYIISPKSPELMARISAAAALRNVAIVDGTEITK